jgi:hypothetical protein
MRRAPPRRTASSRSGSRTPSWRRRWRAARAPPHAAVVGDVGRHPTAPVTCPSGVVSARGRAAAPPGRAVDGVEVEVTSLSGRAAPLAVAAARVSRSTTQRSRASTTSGSEPRSWCSRSLTVDEPPPRRAAGRPPAGRRASRRSSCSRAWSASSAWAISSEMSSNLPRPPHPIPASRRLRFVASSHTRGPPGGGGGTAAAVVPAGTGEELHPRVRRRRRRRPGGSAPWPTPGARTAATRGWR